MSAPDERFVALRDALRRATRARACADTPAERSAAERARARAWHAAIVALSELHGRDLQAALQRLLDAADDGSDDIADDTRADRARAGSDSPPSLDSTPDVPSAHEPES